MTSNGKTLNYKVVDLVERYNFHISLPPSEFKQKITNFWKETGPYRRGQRRTSYRCMYSFLKFFCGSYIFAKREKKNVKKTKNQLFPPPPAEATWAATPPRGKATIEGEPSDEPTRQDRKSHAKRWVANQGRGGGTDSKSTSGWRVEDAIAARGQPQGAPGPPGARDVPLPLHPRVPPARPQGTVSPPLALIMLRQCPLQRFL
jgi:hypothetical protein